MIIDRRSFVLTGSLGLGAFAIPGFAQTANVTGARGFTHSVASGEPGADTMLLWTRYVPANGDSATLHVEIAEDADFRRVVGGGQMVTGGWRDFTAKVVVDGLKPATSYHYRFVAPDGSFSPVGRTRTLPAGPVARFGIGIFSCSNLPFGFFNAYAHGAARDDLDLIVHLGDYFYEYGPGTYPAATEAVAGRVLEPATEIVALADYRLRFASYRADPDLQELHRVKPMIVQWDDHESTNDSWEGGAQNHQPNEGEWASRKAASIQAYREWMPISDEPWKTYDIGTLATLFRTESRLLGRTRSPELVSAFMSPDPIKALIAFRDGPWQDPSSTMLGLAQESWLGHAMAASVRAGKRWQIVGFGTILGNAVTPESAAQWLTPAMPERARGYISAGIAAGKLGLPFNFDNWGGYPAARARFLKSAQEVDANLVVIAGDSHNGWAFDLGQDGKPAGVEFAGHSVTSPGFESSLAIDPKLVAGALVEKNPELIWADTSNRGYMAMTLTSNQVTNDWVMMDTIKTRTARGRVGHTATVARGRNVMT